MREALERDVTTTKPCGVEPCPALAVGASGLCMVHESAERAGAVPDGTKCRACGRKVERGEWITRESTIDDFEHAWCPPKREAFVRKKDRPNPLLEAL